MQALTGFFHLTLVVLAVSGMDKLLRPAGAALAIRSGRLLPTGLLPQRSVKLSMAGARLLGLVELSIAVGGAAAVIESALLPFVGLMIAVAFVGFAWFANRLRSIDDGANCGCFGGGAPPGPLHIVLNMSAAALGATIAVAVGLFGQTIGFDGSVLTLIPYLALVAVGAYLFLVGPSLLSATEARHHIDAQWSHVETFSVTQPVSKREATA